MNNNMHISHRNFIRLLGVGLLIASRHFVTAQVVLSQDRKQSKHTWSSGVRKNPMRGLAVGHPHKPNEYRHVYQAASGTTSPFTA